MRILRGLTSRLLPCGCMAGIYETYDGTVVTLLDDRGPQCQAPGHVEGAAIPELAGASRPAEVALHGDGHGKA